MACVISDSSVLIHLSKIGRLHLLKDFFGEVTIPGAVWREVVEEGKDQPGTIEVERAYREGWIKVLTPANSSLLPLLKLDLDDGEAEVIALALELRADLVLIDESEGRRIAGLYNLPKIGTVGLLIRAKREGRISSLRVELDRLRREGGFWMKEALYLRVLQAVGEEPPFEQG